VRYKESSEAASGGLHITNYVVRLNTALIGQEVQFSRPSSVDYDTVSVIEDGHILNLKYHDRNE
jgi:hypothetical protein